MGTAGRRRWAIAAIVVLVLLFAEAVFEPLLPAYRGCFPGQLPQSVFIAAKAVLIGVCILLLGRALGGAPPEPPDE